MGDAGWGAVALQCKNFPSSFHYSFGDIPRIFLVWAKITEQRRRDRIDRTQAHDDDNLFPSLDVSWHCFPPKTCINTICQVDTKKQEKETQKTRASLFKNIFLLLFLHPYQSVYAER